MAASSSLRHMKISCPQKNDLMLQRDAFEQYRKRCVSRLSAHSFVPLFAWQDFFSYRFEVVDDNLCVFAEHELGEFLLLPPLGNGIWPQVIEHCFQRMKASNGPAGVSRMDNVPLEVLDAFDNGRFDVYCKGHEYCYYRKDIEQLKGNAYKSQRWEINRFIRDNRFVGRRYDVSMKDDCQRLYDQWSGRLRVGKDEVFCQMIDENRSVHRRVLESFDVLDMVGRVVEVDGQIKAYTFGYSVNPEVFCVFVEVADRDVPGLPAYIFREFCADPRVKGFSFINGMDDWGLENLSAVKRSYHPVLLLPSYTVTKKKKET